MFPGAQTSPSPWGLTRRPPHRILADVTRTRQNDWCPKNWAGSLMSTECPQLPHKPHPGSDCSPPPLPGRWSQTGPLEAWGSPPRTFWKAAAATWPPVTALGATSCCPQKTGATSPGGRDRFQDHPLPAEVPPPSPRAGPPLSSSCFFFLSF